MKGNLANVHIYSLLLNWTTSDVNRWAGWNYSVNSERYRSLISRHECVRRESPQFGTLLTRRQSHYYRRIAAFNCRRFATVSSFTLYRVQYLFLYGKSSRLSDRDATCERERGVPCPALNYSMPVYSLSF